MMPAETETFILSSSRCCSCQAPLQGALHGICLALTSCIVFAGRDSLDLPGAALKYNSVSEVDSQQVAASALSDGDQTRHSAEMASAPITAAAAIASGASSSGGNTPTAAAREDAPAPRAQQHPHLPACAHGNGPTGAGGHPGLQIGDATTHAQALHRQQTEFPMHCMGSLRSLDTGDLPHLPSASGTARSLGHSFGFGKRLTAVGRRIQAVLSHPSKRK